MAKLTLISSEHNLSTNQIGAILYDLSAIKCEANNDYLVKNNPNAL
jgi:hypothetical protein